MARIIVVTSGKGGVGKTTAVSLLGKNLAYRGQKVLLIDADLGLKNLDVMLGLESRVIYDVEDVIKGRASLHQALVKDKEYPDLAILPACLHSDVTNISYTHLQQMIADLDSQYDFILIDSPAGIERGFLNAIHNAKEAIVVITLDRASIRDADKVIGLLRAQEIDNVRLLVNRVNRSKSSVITLEDALHVLAIPLLGMMKEDPSLSKAQNSDRFFTHHLYLVDDAVDRLTGNTLSKSRPPFWSRIMKKAHVS